MLVGDAESFVIVFGNDIYELVGNKLTVKSVVSFHSDPPRWRIKRVKNAVVAREKKCSDIFVLLVIVNVGDVREISAALYASNGSKFGAALIDNVVGKCV
jgi:hypothetical protein